MSEDTPSGLTGDTSLEERMQRMRVQLQPLTIPGSGAGIFYSEDDPFDAELRVEFDDGQTVNSVVVPLGEHDVTFLQEQVVDVRTKQRRLLGLDGVSDGRWRAAGAASSLDVEPERNTAIADWHVAAADDSVVDDDGEESASTSSGRVKRARDPMGFGQLLKSVPISDNASTRALIAIVIVFVAFAVISGVMSAVG